MEYPELYLRLRKWRDDFAGEQEVEPYTILQTKILADLVRELPVNLPALKKIKGIGGVKSKLLGNDIIGIIAAFCEEKQIEPGDIAIPPKPAKLDSKLVSYELFRSGKNIETIAAERTMVTSTIEGHLAHFIALGQLDIYELLDREKVAAISTFILENPEATNAEIKTHFEDVYSYGEIKMVQAANGLLG